MFSAAGESAHTQSADREDMKESADAPQQRGFSAKFAKYGGRFVEAVRRFDEENAQDPCRVLVDGVERAHELWYAQKLTEWILRLEPDASEPLLLAVRSQHICRWLIPRKSYEMSRAGYLRWRNDLKNLHARKSAEILREVGYDETTIARVVELNLKKGLGRDRECQVLEDALCLMTLQYQLADLMAKTDPDKMVGILRKTWKKMSDAARNQASALSYTEAERALIGKALAPQ
jgi:hypothetical protein